MIEATVERIVALAGGNLKPALKDEIKKEVAKYAVAAAHDTTLQKEAQAIIQKQQ